MKFLSKIEVFVKTRSFCQKSKFLSKIEIFVKHRQNSKFCQMSIFSEIESFVKILNFCESPKYSAQDPEISTKILNLIKICF